MNTIKASTIIALISLAVLLQPAMAQEWTRSRGEYGANRRVISPDGYGMISGTFYEPTVKGIKVKLVRLPYPIRNPCSATGEISVASATNDVPQMYLGVSAPSSTVNGVSQRGLEVDAGITWQSAKVTEVGKRTDTTNMVGSGWRVFLRVGHCYSNSVVGQFSEPIPMHQLGAMTVGVAVAGSSLYFIYTWPGKDGGQNQKTKQPLPPGLDLNSLAPRLHVKRVIAMTQPGTEAHPEPQYDGSSMVGALFNFGHVQRVTSTTQSFVPAGSLKEWRSVGGQAVHFYPSGRYKDGSAKLKTPFVIQTRAPYNRIIIDGKQNRPDTGLYYREEVDIRMNRVAKGTGAVITQ